MRIIVTGGAGFIGSCFVRLALGNPSLEIANVDKLTYAGNLENLVSVADNPRYSFFQTDICDLEDLRRVFEEVKPDAVVHFAAESHVDRSIFAPQPVFETNLRGTFNLLETMRAQRVARFIHVSTDEVYGSLEAPLEADEQFPLAAQQPVFSGQGGLGSARSELSQDLQASRGRNARVQQLRAVSIPREADPAHDHACLRQ